ncbi:MAG: alcohol dehydrogenase catalytic domain-containing protein [Actinobacteria bacterium]|nr:alcohol dehydrogenase catalytic domain-containing protein [Actinomycetota bacterium]
MVLERPRELVERELPLPEAGDDDGLLRVEACGLCGTDHELYTGALPGPGAFVPGHETVGIVERAGPRAAARWGVSEGDRVALDIFQSCRECDRCATGDYRGCRKHGFRDSYGFVSLGVEPGLWGGYSQYQYLAPDSVLHPVPEGMSPVLATAFNPLGAGIRWAAVVPETKEGDVVAILGPGIRGLSAVAAVKEAGAGFVMITGHGERDTPRLEMARRFGADLAVDVSRTNAETELRKATGGLADVVVDVTAKAPAAFAQAIELARHGGRVVIAGTRGVAEAPGFAPDLLVLKELHVMGSLGVDGESYRAALELLASGRYPFDELPRRVAGLDGASELLAVMAGESDGPPPIHGVIVPWEDA